ncbi:hypothetical protein F2Q69_00020869 [Brassica cretica]|uniref:Uncharacterized protein n=1 Tax=Brassica cretica TaxID=69181 RepID=A0A8S9QAI6_BRACR|nr:hypothetical protein F2Q69_00020869 [Brassica cretica]
MTTSISTRAMSSARCHQTAAKLSEVAHGLVVLCSGEAPSPKTRSCSDHHEPITKPSSSPPPWSATRDASSRATSFPHGHISFSSESQDQTVSAQLRHRRDHQDLQPREAVSSNGYFCFFCKSGPSSFGFYKSAQYFGMCRNDLTN